MATIRRCDRCNSEDKVIYYVESTKRISIHSNIVPTIDFDLCERCNNDLTTFLIGNEVPAIPNPFRSEATNAKEKTAEYITLLRAQRDEARAERDYLLSENVRLSAQVARHESRRNRLVHYWKRLRSGSDDQM